MPSDFRLDRERGISAVRFEIPLAGGRGFGGVEGTRPPRFSPEGKRKKGRSDSLQECPGFLRELSRSGARVESERPIGVQTPVQITVRNQKITAHVTFCTRTPAGFMLGLEVDSASQGLLMMPRGMRSL